MRDDLAEIIFPSMMLESIVSNSGSGRDVHPLTLSIQHFLCRPRRRPPSKVPRWMVLERLSRRVPCPSTWVFLSWQLPVETPMGPQGSLSCSTPNRWPCAPRRRCGEVSSGTWRRKPGSFSQSQQAELTSYTSVVVVKTLLDASTRKAVYNQSCEIKLMHPHNS